MEVILGFNLMGVWYCYEVCEVWIKVKILVDVVLENFGFVNFDLEFYDEYELDII